MLIFQKFNPTQKCSLLMLFFWCFSLQKSPSVSGSLLAEAVLLLDICEPLAAANAHNDGGEVVVGGGSVNLGQIAKTRQKLDLKNS